MGSQMPVSLSNPRIGNINTTTTMTAANPRQRQNLESDAMHSKDPALQSLSGRQH